MATATALAAVEGGARQIECTINGLGERAGNTALEEVVMAMRVRNDIMPFHTRVDAKKIMHISRRVSTVSGFAVQFNKAIVGKNAFAHESGIHQDGMLKSADTFEIMRPEDIGLSGTSLPLGKHSGRAALRAKLKELGFELADNQLNDVFVRFKALADRKKEVYDDDIVALVTDTGAIDASDHLELKFLRVICGTEAPQHADLVIRVGDEENCCIRYILWMRRLTRSNRPFHIRRVCSFIKFMPSPKGPMRKRPYPFGWRKRGALPRHNRLIPIRWSPASRPISTP